MNDDAIAQELSRARRASLVAAAGCGKTETLTKAAGLHAEGRQLVLTHTHAGVKAIRDRLTKLRVSLDRVQVETIAGFSLRYAASYPLSSGIQSVQPRSSEWAAVYEAAGRIVGSAVGRRVIQESYAGLFVDEYQDCNLDQHALVMTIAEALPTRVVLDPLQGIFDFGGQVLVDLERDVETNFERLPDLETPWRWVGANPDLGDWLLEVRRRLLAGTPINLADAPVVTGPRSLEEQFAACMRVAKVEGSVVAIRQWARDCHSLASRLQGTYTAMEPMECPDLLDWSAALQHAEGCARAAKLLGVASCCLTRVGDELGSARDALASGRLPTIRANTRHPEAVAALIRVTQDESFVHLPAAMDAIERAVGVLYRRELWRDLRRAARECGSEPEIPLADVAWRVRDRARHLGRRVDHRTVSRTLLVKGLEFDHCVVLDADELNARNLYVALTRPRRSLTVLSADSTLRPSA